jgi:hypothetical protein
MEEWLGALNIDDHAYEWVCTTIIANINTDTTVPNLPIGSRQKIRKNTETFNYVISGTFTRTTRSMWRTTGPGGSVTNYPPRYQGRSEDCDGD